MKKLPMRIQDMAEVVKSARAELNRLYALRGKRDSALQKLESEETKKQMKPDFIFQRQMEARSKAREDSNPVFDEIAHLLKPLAGEPQRWSRSAIMRRARFAPRAKHVTEYASNKEIQQLHGTMLDVLDTQRRLYWALTLPGMSGEELLSVAREAAAEENPALLDVVSREYNRRPIKADDVAAGRQKVEMMELVDSLELDEEKQATAVFQQVEELGREANHLFDDLTATDTLASKQAAKAMSDDEFLRQFHQRNQ